MIRGGTPLCAVISFSSLSASLPFQDPGLPTLLTADGQRRGFKAAATPPTWGLNIPRTTNTGANKHAPGSLPDTTGHLMSTQCRLGWGEGGGEGWDKGIKVGPCPQGAFLY